LKQIFAQSHSKTTCLSLCQIQKDYATVISSQVENKDEPSYSHTTLRISDKSLAHYKTYLEEEIIFGREKSKVHL